MTSPATCAADTERLKPHHDRLHLGCGTDIRSGWTNLDVVGHAGVDVVCDMTAGLPFAPNAFRHILAVDVLEHVPQSRVIFVMNELHRVLASGGKLEVKVPEAPGMIAFQDPTHLSYWNSESFTYYLQGHRRRENYGVHYGISACYRLQSLRRRRPHWRRFFGSWNPAWLTDCVLDVELEAVK